jgi:hypothetical protein
VLSISVGSGIPVGLPACLPAYTWYLCSLVYAVRLKKPMRQLVSLEIIPTLYPYQPGRDLRYYQSCTNFIPVSVQGIILPALYQSQLNLGFNSRTKLVLKVTKNKRTGYEAGMNVLKRNQKSILDSILRPSWYQSSVSKKRTQYQPPGLVGLYACFKKYPIPRPCWYEIF